MIVWFLLACSPALTPTQFTLITSSRDQRKSVKTILSTKVHVKTTASLIVREGWVPETTLS